MSRKVYKSTKALVDDIVAGEFKHEIIVDNDGICSYANDDEECEHDLIDGSCMGGGSPRSWRFSVRSAPTRRTRDAKADNTAR